MIAVVSVFLCLFFASFCAWGGQGPKWMRRFLAPLVFGGGVILISLLQHKFSLWVILGCAWYCPSLLLFKYGVNDGNIFKKILLRGLYGSSLGVSGLLIGIGLGHPWLGAVQLILAGTFCIAFGVGNFFPNSWGNWATIAEDLCIYFLAVCLVPVLLAR